MSDKPLLKFPIYYRFFLYSFIYQTSHSCFDAKLFSRVDGIKMLKLIVPIMCELDADGNPAVIYIRSFILAFVQSGYLTVLLVV